MPAAITPERPASAEIEPLGFQPGRGVGQEPAGYAGKLPPPQVMTEINEAESVETLAGIEIKRVSQRDVQTSSLQRAGSFPEGIICHETYHLSPDKGITPAERREYVFIRVF